MGLMNFKANADALIDLGVKVKVDADNYDQEIKKIYSAVDNLGAAWKGEDNQAYVNKVNEYKSAIDDLGKAIRNHGQFLDDTGKNINNIKHDILSNASNM